MASDPENTSQRALRRFESGQTDFEEIVDARGLRTFMIRDQDDPRFFRIETEDPNGGFSVSATGLRLPPSQERPRELPRHLPFIPGVTTVVMIMPATGSVVVRWENPTDPAGTFHQVREELLQGGWLEETREADRVPSKEGSPHAFRLQVRKETASRTLILFDGESQSDLVLTEDPVT
jgi:hypothetical protein